MAVPTAPTALAAAAGDNALTVSWTDPTSDPVVSGHQMKVGGAAWKNCAASPVVVSGLTNGKAVTIQVRAVNADGNGAAASASGTPADTNPANDNGYDDASFYANPGLAVPHLDWDDPDD
jgi:hypothetical protein